MRSAKVKDVDDYIANALDYTRPILVKLRRIFRQASPKLEPAIKWACRASSTSDRSADSRRT